MNRFGDDAARIGRVAGWASSPRAEDRLRYHVDLHIEVDPSHPRFAVMDTRAGALAVRETPPGDVLEVVRA